MLYVDIETLPNVILHWNAGKAYYISPDQIIKEREIFCICYKWEGEKKVHSLVTKRKNMFDKDGMDRDMLIKISKVWDEADEIVTQNGDRFDIPWINARLCILELPPLPQVRQTDTLKENRKLFNFNGYGQDYVNKLLGGTGKQLKLDWALQKRLLGGCKMTAKDVVKYCKKDVTDLERINLRTRPYRKVKKNPVFLDKCSNCGGSNMIKNGLFFAATGFKYQRAKCKDCNQPHTSSCAEKDEMGQYV